MSKLEETHNWDKFVRLMLMSYNTSWQVSIRLTPYYLIFEKNLKLPIKKTMLSRNTILDRIIELIHKVSIFRENAKVAINKAQQKIKANYSV